MAGDKKYRNTNLLSHVSFGVQSMPQAEPFYNAVFSALEIPQVYRDSPVDSAAKICGWGSGPEQEVFTLFEHAQATPGAAGNHLAFNAPSRSSVNNFHTAAIAAGGRCNGRPGIRTEYGENYYACFVFDPDGHKLEAVYQQPLTHTADASFHEEYDKLDAGRSASTVI